MNNKPFNIVNISLIVAVAVLYYFQFSCAGNCDASGTCDSDSTEVAASPLIISEAALKTGKTVYVNSDILNKKYEFVKDLATATIAKQQRLELAYQTKGQKLQQDFVAFQQKASQGLLSENQIGATQKDLQKRKDELDGMEGQLQKMMEEIQRRNEEVRQTVTSFIKNYNESANYDYILTYTDGPGGIVLFANDSLDITNEIVEGLNAQYRASKVKKK